jgi:hypothetical protein
VGGGVDRTADAMALTDRPVLLEGRRSFDGGFVGAGGLKDCVSTPINCHRALLGGGARGVVAAEALDDVVLDERVCSPTID